jgi:hypothetical protein
MQRWLALCVAASALLLAAGASAHGLARNGRIGYLRPLGGNNPPYGHLFAIDPGGSGAVDLTPATRTSAASPGRLAGP